MPANIPSWKSPDSIRLMTPRTGKINPAAPEAEHQTGKAAIGARLFEAKSPKRGAARTFPGMQGWYLRCLKRL